LNLDGLTILIENTAGQGTALGVQAEGASPLAEAFLKGRREMRPWKDPETVASAIRIGNPVSWKKALKALVESKGTALAVSDDEILRARRDLAAKEGTFVENASASPVAALKKLQGRIGPSSTVVCILTGHGLKDKLPPRWRTTKRVAGDLAGLLRALS
jgi:threonine synthase